MSRVTKVTGEGPQGRIRYRLNWYDNHGVCQREFFETRDAAEGAGLAIEMQLFNEAVQRFLQMGPPQQ